MAQRSGLINAEQAADVEAIEARQRADDRKRRVRAYRAQNGLKGTIYEPASLDSLDYPRRMLSPADFNRYVGVRDFLSGLVEDPKIVVLSGPNGPGKTYLGAATANAFCDAEASAFVCTAVMYYRLLASTFGESGRTEEDFYKRMHGYNLLVVDEIERRANKEWHQIEFFDLINSRYNSGRATILITNKTPMELNGTEVVPGFLEKSLRDRIRERGGQIIHCDWASLRRAQR